MVPIAVETGVVVIVVALVVLAVVAIVALGMRGRDQSRSAARRELDDAHERAGRAEGARDIAQQQADQSPARGVDPPSPG
jgi:hypothetical protein